MKANPIQRSYLACAILAGLAMACSTTESPDTQSATAGIGSGSGSGSFVDAAPEPTLVAHPYFTCDPDAMGAEMVVTEVLHRPGDEVLIEKTASPCQVDLVYRESGGGDTVLSGSADGYLLVEAVDRLVCGSVIANQPVSGGPTHEITRVTIDCALRSSSGSWLPIQRIIDGDAPPNGWAAWIYGMRKQDASTYVVTYARDFTFQFMTVSDQHPPADGVYEATVSIAGDTISVIDTVKVSDHRSTLVVEDPTPGCPEGAFDPANPLCAQAQSPGSAQFDGTPTGSNINWSYNMGYRFTPQADGAITGLGGYWNGTKTVRLYDAATGAVLAATSHESANAYSYTPIAPVAVSAGSSYVVAVWLAGSGGAWDGPYPVPATIGDIQIDCQGVYGTNATAMPTTCASGYVYGMADIEFRPGDPDAMP